MCTKLNKIHQDLNSIHQKSAHLRENIIRACRSYSAVHVDLFNSFNSTFDLVNSLYTSIVNYESIHKFASNYLLSEKADKSYYIDRQYRKDDLNEEKYRSLRERQQKRCFVYAEEDCWLSNHSQEDRDLARKRFERKHSEYKKRSNYDRRMNQYIMHCEDENSKDDSTQFFEEEELFEEHSTQFFEKEITLDVSNNIVDEDYSYSNAFST